MKKKPNMKDKIDALAEQGLEVDILHMRRYSTPEKFDEYPTLLAKGGVTVANILSLEDGELVVQGKAYCSEQENYNRKIGGHIALGRAIKEGIARGRIKNVL